MAIRECFEFTLGALKCTVLIDAYGIYPVSALAENVSEEEVARVFGGLSKAEDDIHLPYNCLLVQDGKRNILVDAGLGGGMAWQAGQLLKRLEAVGILPEEIGTIILTHTDADHIGGLLDGEGKLAFPNARYVLWKSTWKTLYRLAQNEIEYDLDVQVYRAMYEGLEDWVELVKEQTEFLHGFQFIPAEGHRPGHAAVRITSQGEVLLYVGDVFILPVHVEHPDWMTSFDERPEVGVRDRRRFLEIMTAENPLVVGSHFSLPALGHVKREGNAWKWLPNETT